jgi:hypothetical protein
MSERVFEGDEWKHARPEPPTLRSMTRAEAQKMADADYAIGRITLDNWREITKTLSEPLMAL